MKNVKVMLFLVLSIVAPMAYGMDELDFNQMKLTYSLIAYPGIQTTKDQFKKFENSDNVIDKNFVNLLFKGVNEDGKFIIELKDLKNISDALTPNSKAKLLFDQACKEREGREKWSKNQKIGLGAGAAVIAAGGLYLGRKGYQKYKKWKREQEELKRKAAEPIIEDIEIVENAE